MEPAVELRNLLIDVRRREPPLEGRAYRGPADFVLRHGEWFPPSPYLLVGAPNTCYGSSIVTAAALGLEYVEGFALARQGSPQNLFAHAWVLDAAGRAVDPAWATTPIRRGVAYLGVRFSVERGDRESWDGDAHVLRDPPSPLYDVPWTGEVEQEPSEWVRAWREGTVEECERIAVQRELELLAVTEAVRPHS